MFFDLKSVFSVLGAACSLFAYVPYLRDMLARRTEPHAFTWLIWTISTGTAAAASWLGGGGYGSLAQGFGSFLTLCFFFASLRYGTKDITRSDVFVLLVALSAVGVWVFLDNPLLAVIMVTLIDFLAYIPTYRKLWKQPQSESLFGWVFWTLAPIFFISAFNTYNALTLTYPLMTLSANIALLLLILIRSRMVASPSRILKG
jgi:hypothetical protein